MPHVISYTPRFFARTEVSEGAFFSVSIKGSKDPRVHEESVQPGYRRRAVICADGIRSYAIG